MGPTPSSLDYLKQIQLALHLCQLDLRGTVQNKSLSVGDATLVILCWLEDFKTKKGLETGKQEN